MRRGTSSAATSERARVVRLKVAKVAPRITGVTLSPLVPVWRALPRASLRAAPTLSNVANRWRGWRNRSHRHEPGGSHGFAGAFMFENELLQMDASIKSAPNQRVTRRHHLPEICNLVCSSNRYNKNTNSNLSPGCTRRQTSRTSSNLQKWVHR
uniref:(northern house mosquito) hypothetical protein n=1 Tax=Culex pipiens TaxID=7175 RepID=A0A8D8GJV6_CULPI